MTAPLIFLDFECTGLRLDDEPWEFAAIRREPDGTETEWHTFIEHDARRAALLPEPFASDHAKRYDPQKSVTRDGFARWVWPLFEGKPHIVGAVPDFDVTHLRALLDTNRIADRWHYHLIDVETLAVGYLRGYAVQNGVHVDSQDDLVLPWDSDALSLQLDIEPPGEGVRHTAMGDVLWTRAIWDRIMGELVAR